MVRSRMHTWVAAMALVWVVGAATPASAGMIDGPGPLRKLSRGVANSCTGLLELPYTVLDTQKEDGIVPALSWGVLSGLRAAVVRTAVGVTELVTFPFPFPKAGYRPMLMPEFFPDHAVTQS